MKRRLTRGQSAVLLMAVGVAAIGVGVCLVYGLGVALIVTGGLAAGLALLVGWQ
ncbi:hypothetical protein ACWFQT_01425 [Cellulosimicrobium cellulans]